MTQGHYIGKIVASDVDGPGTRAVVHFAGCNIGCIGCFNPHTHDADAEGVWTADASGVARRMLTASRHVTISGGEPTDQPEALLALLIALKDQGVESVVLFTGRRVEWLYRNRSEWSQIMTPELVDVVIDGPYVKTLDEPNPVMRGSSNQRIFTVSDKYTLCDFEERDIQISLTADGMTLTGFPDAELLEALMLAAG